MANTIFVHTFFLVLLSAVICSSVDGRLVQAPSDNNLNLIRDRNMMYLVGDSITQFSAKSDGFQTLLSNWYYAKVDIINRGFSGYNTDLVRYMVEKEYDQTFLTLPSNSNRQLLLVLCLGANDACFDSSPTKQHVPLDRYRQNIMVIIDTVLKATNGKANFLLMTPPPMNATQYNENVGNGYRDNAHTSQYAQVVRDIVNLDKSNVYLNLVDLWDNMKEWNVGHPFSDGLHMSAQGNQIIFEHIKAVIKKKLPQFDAEVMKDPFDSWYDALKKFHNETSTV